MQQMRLHWAKKWDVVDWCTSYRQTHNLNTHVTKPMRAKISDHTLTRMSTMLCVVLRFGAWRQQGSWGTQGCQHAWHAWHLLSRLVWSRWWRWWQMCRKHIHGGGSGGHSGNLPSTPRGMISWAQRSRSTERRPDTLQRNWHIKGWIRCCNITGWQESVCRRRRSWRRSCP